MSTEKKNDSRKPLVFGTSYADDLDRIAQFGEDIEADPSWIPGYSEQIRANDIAAVDPTMENFTTDRRMKTREGVQLREHYLRKYGEPKPLTVNFKWLRVNGMDGAENQNVRTDLIPYLADGYRFITFEELERLGYGKPPAATISADGLIRRGDVALAVVDAERARANAAKRARENAEREQSTLKDGVVMFEHSRERNYTL